jgi:DNA-binding transcriptional LysR family regulator
LQRFLSEKAERLGRRLKLRVQLRSFDAICRFVECNVGVGIVPATSALRLSRTMAIRRVELIDAWAVRELKICLRRAAELPLYARQLVRHLEAARQDQAEAGDR